MRIDLNKLQGAQLTSVTEEAYWDMLEALPPERMADNAFLVGEPTSHLPNGEALYCFFFREGNRHYRLGLLTAKAFDRALVETTLLQAVAEKDTKTVQELAEKADAGEVIRMY